MRRRLGWIFAIVLLFPLLPGMGCDCGPDISLAKCDKNTDCTGRKCPAGKVCYCRDGLCKPRGGVCSAKADCAPDEECKDGKCISVRCTKDDECPADKPKCNVLLGVCVAAEGCTKSDQCSGGKVCCDLGDGQGDRCNFEKCLVHEDCKAGSKNTCVKPISCTGAAAAACIGGVCKCEEPCGGADCGSGRCCNTGDNKCIDNPKPCPDLKCPPGTDPPEANKYSTDPKSCKVTGPECKCVKREPLPVGEAGLDSEIGMLNDKPVVSGYNKTYGDLVVGFQQADGTLKWEFVDGIPAGAAVKGAADGPRGGIEEGGDDVGQHTSLAVGGGNVHVSYHDSTNGTLKYALRNGTEWKNHVVDKNGKVIGRFTTITLVKGNPVIAYFVADDGAGKTELRVAVAKSATPASDADWTISKVDGADRPACKGQCDASKKEECVQEGTTFSCKVPTAKAADCKPKACKDGAEACVGAKCLAIVPDSANPPLPKGVGLFPSIAAIPSGGFVITYYDANKGDLKIALQTGTGPFKLQTLASTGDTGQFTSVAVDTQNRIHVAFINVDNTDVHYMQLDNQLKTTIDELVDDGFANSSTGGEERLLADCSIAVDAQGNPRIVYQDATVQSIKVAVRKGAKQWELKKLAGEGSADKGAFGFFADQVIVGGTSYISNYKYNLAEDKSSIDLRTFKP